MNLNREELAELIAHGIKTALAGVLGQVKTLRTDNTELRRELDTVKAELHAVRSKMAGGALTVERR